MPVGCPQYFPDLRVRKLVEEGQAPKDVEMFLVIELVVFLPEVFVNARQFG